jgi:hypothetical protein
VKTLSSSRPTAPRSGAGPFLLPFANIDEMAGKACSGKSCDSSMGYGHGLPQPEWEYRMKIDTNVQNLTFNVGRIVHG